MKTASLLLLAWLTLTNQAGRDLYACKNVEVSIYSKAPVEDIAALTRTGTSVYNATTGDLVFSINIRSLHFEKERMQEHFNENYMESYKYPAAVFRGKLSPVPDLSKDGVYNVTASGDLEVHGVKQHRSIPGIVTVKAGEVSMTSEFAVKCADHRIDIPKLVFYNIAESIQVHVNAQYQSSK